MHRVRENAFTGTRYGEQPQGSARPSVADTSTDIPALRRQIDALAQRVADLESRQATAGDTGAAIDGLGILGQRVRALEGTPKPADAGAELAALEKRLAAVEERSLPTPAADDAPVADGAMSDADGQELARVVQAGLAHFEAALHRLQRDHAARLEEIENAITAFGLAAEHKLKQAAAAAAQEGS